MKGSPPTTLVIGFISIAELMFASTLEYSIWLWIGYGVYKLIKDTEV